MDVYYDDNLTTYTRMIGKTNLFNKINLGRKVKKAVRWYFADKFGFTINVVGLVWLVI